MDLFIWIGFIVVIFSLVLFDLGVLHREARAPTVREALCRTAVWVALAMPFNVFVYFLYEYDWLGWGADGAHQLGGQEAALQFFTGYVLEKSLSVDNIFVIAMVFSFFRVPPALQHRVLFWGILGAVVLRGLMIAIGAVLIARFEWIVYVFGVLLIFSAIRMLRVQEGEVHPDRNLLVRLTRRFFPVTQGYVGSQFFATVRGKPAVTPLFLALILVESCDVMFAIDSIPAIFAVTRDPFLVFTSNVFAILGLRSLFFAVSGLMDKFHYLKFSLVFVLGYIGAKMLLSHHWPIPNGVSLAIIATILSIGVGASLLRSEKPTAQPLLSGNHDAVPEPAPPHSDDASVAPVAAAPARGNADADAGD